MKNDNYRSSLKISWVSIFVNIFIAALKFILGLLSNSIAILTDAVHSLEDLITSALVIISLHASRKPPDEGHPFGHGRAEDVGGLILSIILFIVGIGFFKNAALRFFSPEPVNINFVFIGLILFSAAVKLILGIFTDRISKKVSSNLLKTDALHHYGDFITSIAVVIGLVFVMMGYVWADSLLGILISIIIAFWAVKMARGFIDNLIGKRAPEAVYRKIRSIAFSSKYVEGVHDIEVHSYGENRIVSLHVEIDPSISLDEAHEIADSIEKKVLEDDLGRCIVHVDVKDKKKTIDRKEVEKFISKMITPDNNIKGFHKIEILTTTKKNILNFHLLLDKGVTLDSLHSLCHRLAKILKKEFGFWKVNIHSEPYQGGKK